MAPPLPIPLNFTPLYPSYISPAGGGTFAVNPSMQAALGVTRTWTPEVFRETFETTLGANPPPFPASDPLIGNPLVPGWINCPDGSLDATTLICWSSGSRLGGFNEMSLFTYPAPFADTGATKATTRQLGAVEGKRLRFSFEIWDPTLPATGTQQIGVFPATTSSVNSNGPFYISFDCAGTIEVWYNAGHQTFLNAFVPGPGNRVRIKAEQNATLDLIVYIDLGAGWTVLFSGAGVCTPLTVDYVTVTNYGITDPAANKPIGSVDGIVLEPLAAVPVTVATNSFQGDETTNPVSAAGVASLSYGAYGSGFLTNADKVSFQTSLDLVHFASAGPDIEGAAGGYGQQVNVAIGGYAAHWIVGSLPDDYDFMGVALSVLEVMI